MLRYTYNSDKRPVEVHRGNTLIANYTYNAFGERVKKVVHSATGTPRITYLPVRRTHPVGRE